MEMNAGYFDNEHCCAYFDFIDQGLPKMHFAAVGNALSFLSKLLAVRYSGYDRLGLFQRRVADP